MSDYQHFDLDKIFYILERCHRRWFWGRLMFHVSVAWYGGVLFSFGGWNSSYLGMLGGSTLLMVFMWKHYWDQRWALNTIRDSVFRAFGELKSSGFYTPEMHQILQDYCVTMTVDAKRMTLKELEQF